MTAECCQAFASADSEPIRLAVDCAAASLKVCEPCRRRKGLDPSQIQLLQPRQRGHAGREVGQRVTPQVELPQLRQQANAVRQRR